MGSLIKIYATGGTGVNIGKTFAKWDGKDSAGFAKIETVFVDTSQSNMDEVVPRDKIYLVEGLEGNGKLRSSNYDPISESCNDILHQFRPGDVNIVLHGAGGGSGSVIGPLLVSELLARGEMVIALVVGSTSSRIETKNTVNTLASYEKISELRKAPVNVLYRENSVDKPRKVVDNEMINAVVLFTSLFSGFNQGLDKEDCKNFLNFHKVTSYLPKLSYLDLFTKTVTLDKGQALVSLMTLTDEENSSESNIPTEYQAVGFINNVFRENARLELPVHAAIIAGYFNQLIDKLQKKLSEFQEVRALVSEKTIIDKNTSSTDQGLIL